MDLAYPTEFGKLIIPNVSYFPAVKPDICLPYFLSEFWYRFFTQIFWRGRILLKKRRESWFDIGPTAVTKFQHCLIFKYFSTYIWCHCIIHTLLGGGGGWGRPSFWCIWVFFLMRSDSNLNISLGNVSTECELRKIVFCLSMACVYFFKKKIKIQLVLTLNKRNCKLILLLIVALLLWPHPYAVQYNHLSPLYIQQCYRCHIYKLMVP